MAPPHCPASSWGHFLSILHSYCARELGTSRASIKDIGTERITDLSWCLQNLLLHVSPKWSNGLSRLKILNGCEGLELCVFQQFPFTKSRPETQELKAIGCTGSGDLEILGSRKMYVITYTCCICIYMYMYKDDERYEGGEFWWNFLTLGETFMEALGKKYRGNKHSKKGISAFAYLCSWRLPCIVFALQCSKPLYWVFLVQEAAREQQASRTATREKSPSPTDV